MQTRIITLTVAAPRDTVFNFLADIEHLPRWTGGFCEWIELHRDGWWAYTALGELAVETKVDDIAGVIDLCFKHSAGWKIVIPVRVRTDGDGGALVSLACAQSAGLSDEHYERLIEALLTGLRDFAGRFHAELTAA
jgi:hypothetical protein